MAGLGDACLLSQSRLEAKNKRIAVQAGLSRKRNTISKITRAKRIEAVAQVVECSLASVKS
jgi:hypothetical protein